MGCSLEECDLVLSWGCLGIRVEDSRINAGVQAQFGCSRAVPTCPCEVSQDPCEQVARTIKSILNLGWPRTCSAKLNSAFVRVLLLDG